MVNTVNAMLEVLATFVNDGNMNKNMCDTRASQYFYHVCEDICDTRASIVLCDAAVNIA